MANASEMGLNDLESLFIAYQTDAETAMRNMEMKDSPHSRSLEGLENLARYRGNQVGLQYAEAFEILRKIQR